jgi:glycosyltransferase involved in cell wall biosynthesis
MHLESLSTTFDIDTIIISRSSSQNIENWIPEPGIFSAEKPAQSYIGHGKAYLKWRNSNTKKNRYVRFFLKLFCSPLNSKAFDHIETADLNQIIGDQHYDIIFAFRISMGRAARAIIQSNPTLYNAVRVIDFDDIESKTKLRESSSIRIKEGRLNELLYRLEAKKIAWLENQQQKFFQHVYVCSKDDKKDLDTRWLNKHTSNIKVLPNAVDLPTTKTTAANATNKTTSIPNLLFVGTMDHGPNADAIHYIIEELHPQLVTTLGDHFAINIVGRYPTEQILAYAAIPQIHIHADVPNIDPYYDQADIVIAPIRYGGGTRLKIIEAFAYGKPVVSTGIGAEGIAAENGHAIIIADTAEQLAKECANLLQNSTLAQQIADNAHNLYLETYSYQACRKVLATHMAELGFQ